MAYQIKCDRCGTVRRLTTEPMFTYDVVLPDDWQRLAMGRQREAAAEVSAQLCPECSALVRRFVTANTLRCEGCK